MKLDAVDAHGQFTRAFHAPTHLRVPDAHVRFQVGLGRFLIQFLQLLHGDFPRQRALLPNAQRHLAVLPHRPRVVHNARARLARVVPRLEVLGRVGLHFLEEI